MELWPAIDIREGRCVRLRQGDFTAETSFGDPVEVAVSYLEAGAERLHVVDLDAALTGEPRNRDVIIKIVRRTGLPVQAGGGIRDRESAAALLDSGVSRVVLGTAAVTGDRPVLEWLLSRWPGRVSVGLDYRSSKLADGTVRRDLAVRGWTEASGVEVSEALEWLDGQPVASVVVTDIRKDGTGAGPDVTEYASLLERTSLPLVASGGVGSRSDIVRLARVTAAGRRLSGVIVGKALLTGALSLRDARQAALGPSR